MGSSVSRVYPRGSEYLTRWVYTSLWLMTSFPKVPYSMRYDLLFLLLAAPGLLHAQPQTTLVVRPGTLPNLVPVMADKARCVALSEAHKLLAFGHDRTYPDADLSLFTLDAKGMPSPAAVTINLPCPSDLHDKKVGNYATGLAFHPKLPILYVWQDINLAWINPPKLDKEAKEFDHLLIYDVAKMPPKLLVQMCRDREVLYGQNGGGLAVDPAGEALFVPNLRESSNAGSWRFGRYLLDADGLPQVLGDEEQKLPIAERCAKIHEWKTEKVSAPADKTPPDFVNMFAGNFFGSAMSMTALGRDVCLAGGVKGIMTYRPNDKAAALNGLAVKGHTGTMMTVHPALPLIFAVRVQSDFIACVQHVEGYLTGVPRHWVLPETKLLSTGLAGKGKVVAGAVSAVYVVSFNDNFEPVGDAIAIPINAPAGVRAMVYSQAFDLLYVGTDLSK